MKNHKKFISIAPIAGLILLCLFGCTGHERNDMSEADKQQIADTLTAMEKAALERWGNGDPDGFLEMIAPDYTYFDPSIDKRVDNFEGIKEMYDGIRGQIHIERFELIDPKVQIEGDIAVLTFNHKGYDKMSDGTVAESSHWHTTEVFRKFEEGWKLISTHWSYAWPQLVKAAAQNAFSGDPSSVKEISVSPLAGEVAETVFDMEQAALDRWGQGDVSGYIDITADDYTYFDPSLEKRLDGLTTFKKYLEPLRGNIRIDRAEFINPRVQTDGTTAVLTFNLQNYNIGEDGEEAPGSLWHSTEIYRKTSDTWKLISTHWSYTHSTLKKLSESGTFNIEGS